MLKVKYYKRLPAALFAILSIVLVGATSVSTPSPFGASVLGETTDVDAIITLGSVIQGETKHFDFVCQGVSNGITQLNITLDIPVIFGLLTDNTLQQAIDRSGGKLGNKGIECAIACLKMVELKISIGNTNQKIGF